MRETERERERERPRRGKEKLAAPEGVPKRSPTLVLTRPVPLNFGGRMRSGAFDTVWPPAKFHHELGEGRRPEQREREREREREKAAGRG